MDHILVIHLSKDIQVVSTIATYAAMDVGMQMPAFNPFMHPEGKLLDHCYSSVAQSCLTPCDPTDCSMPGFPVLHHLPELAQTCVR